MNKVREVVEYCVFNPEEDKDMFKIDNNKVVEIKVPSGVKPISNEYVFIYVGNLKADPKSDFKIEEDTIKLRRPISKEGMIVKIYSKHDSYKNDDIK